MDINEDHGVQCFNCQEALEQEERGVCELCLSAESSKAISLKATTQDLTQHLSASQSGFSPQLQHYSSFYSHPSLQELELKLAELQLQQTHLRQEEGKISGQLGEAREQLVRKEKEVQQEWRQLDQIQMELSSLMGWEREEVEKADELGVWRIRLERLSLLNQLYRVHFEDKAAFINREPLTHLNSPLLLEMLAHIMRIYSYKSTSKLTTAACPLTHQRSPLGSSSPQSTLPWLSVVIRETEALWNHIKKEAGGRLGLSLPFAITVDPEPSVGDIGLRADPGYPQLLKCLAHDLKFLVSLEFSLRQ